MGLARRQLKSRSTRWATGLARALANLGIRPNLVSIFSMVFAFGSGACLVAVEHVDVGSRVALFIGAIAGIQLRLLCNLMDGMLAIEHGMKSPLGDLYNDVPDRVADSLTLIGYGYAAFGAFHVELGWLAALLAIFTAYLRVLGGSLQIEQRYLGPMAKQHRMALATAGLVIAIGLGSTFDARMILYVTLLALIAGTFVTCLRRLNFIASGLRARAPK